VPHEDLAKLPIELARQSSTRARGLIAAACVGAVFAGLIAHQTLLAPSRGAGVQIQDPVGVPQARPTLRTSVPESEGLDTSPLQQRVDPPQDLVRYVHDVDRSCQPTSPTTLACSASACAVADSLGWAGPSSFLLQSLSGPWGVAQQLSASMGLPSACKRSQSQWPANLKMVYARSAHGRDCAVYSLSGSPDFDPASLEHAALCAQLLDGQSMAPQ